MLSNFAVKSHPSAVAYAGHPRPRGAPGPPPPRAGCAHLVRGDHRAANALLRTAPLLQPTRNTLSLSHTLESLIPGNKHAKI